MTRDEHKNIVNQLLGMASPEQQAAASDLLTQLSDDYEKQLTDNETLTANNQTLTTNNETLRQVNAKLFLRVGESDKNMNNKNNNPEPGNEGDDNKLTFEALFDEKGDLI